MRRAPCGWCTVHPSQETKPLESLSTSRLELRRLVMVVEGKRGVITKSATLGRVASLTPKRRHDACCATPLALTGGKGSNTQQVH